MSSDVISYDVSAWQAHIDSWLRSVTRSASTRVTQCTASHLYLLQFNCSWQPSSLAQPLDLSTLHESIATQLGPLVRIVDVNVTNRHLVVGVLPVPQAASASLHHIMSSSRDLLGTVGHSLKKRRSACALFMFSLANVAAASLLLHNHWHAYNEPWHGVVDFIHYHLF